MMFKRIILTLSLAAFALAIPVPGPVPGVVGLGVAALNGAEILNKPGG